MKMEYNLGNSYRKTCSSAGANYPVRW